MTALGFETGGNRFGLHFLKLQAQGLSVEERDAAMTFIYFLRGLWFRAKFPIRRFVVDTVRLGDPIPMLSEAQIARLQAEKEAKIAKAELMARKTNIVTGPCPKPADETVVVDPPLLQGDYRESLKRVMKTKTP